MHQTRQSKPFPWGLVLKISSYRPIGLLKVEDRKGLKWSDLAISDFGCRERARIKPLSANPMPSHPTQRWSKLLGNLISFHLKACNLRIFQNAMWFKLIQFKSSVKSTNAIFLSQICNCWFGLPTWLAPGARGCHMSQHGTGKVFLLSLICNCWHGFPTWLAPGARGRHISQHDTDNVWKTWQVAPFFLYRCHLSSTL